MAFRSTVESALTEVGNYTPITFHFMHFPTPLLYITLHFFSLPFLFFVFFSSFVILSRLSSTYFLIFIPNPLALFIDWNGVCCNMCEAFICQSRGAPVQRLEHNRWSKTKRCQVKNAHTPFLYLFSVLLFHSSFPYFFFITSCCLYVHEYDLEFYQL